MQFAQHRQFYSLKELTLQWETHFKPYLAPKNTSFTLTDVDSRNLVDIPYEFTFIMLSLNGNCACRLPIPLCRCNNSAGIGRAVAASSSITPIVAPGVMFTKINWRSMPWRLTESYSTFRESFNKGSTGRKSVKIITDAYIATGKPPEAPLTEKLSPYGVDFVTKLYLEAIGSPAHTSANSELSVRSGTGMDSKALMRVMGNQVGLIPAMYWLFKPRSATGERKATSMKPLVSEAMLKANAINNA